MIDYILMDVEGTTTAIDFVHKTLFPYAREHMGAFLEAQGADPQVQAALADAANTVETETGERPDAAGTRDALLAWIAEDRKHPALKKLQGMIWKNGYETKAYCAHLYDDVLPCWERWREADKALGIYSSGSVQAQQLLFGHTEAGDVNHYLSHYFDTGVGHKREEASYRKILKTLGKPGERVLFLSDVTDELDAARAAGMCTVQLVRPGTIAGDQHPTATDFHEISVA